MIVEVTAPSSSAYALTFDAAFNTVRTPGETIAAGTTSTSHHQRRQVGRWQHILEAVTGRSRADTPMTAATSVFSGVQLVSSELLTTTGSRPVTITDTRIKAVWIDLVGGTGGGGGGGGGGGASSSGSYDGGLGNGYQSAELQHRIKNILAVVRSVLTRTLESSSDLDRDGAISWLVRAREPMAALPPLRHLEQGGHRMGKAADRTMVVAGLTAMALKAVVAAVAVAVAVAT